MVTQRRQILQNSSNQLSVKRTKSKVASTFASLEELESLSKARLAASSKRKKRRSSL